LRDNNRLCDLLSGQRFYGIGIDEKGGNTNSASY
jgi:hypothetical protein